MDNEGASNVITDANHALDSERQQQEFREKLNQDHSEETNQDPKDEESLLKSHELRDRKEKEPDLQPLRRSIPKTTMDNEGASNVITDANHALDSGRQQQEFREKLNQDHSEETNQDPKDEESLLKSHELRDRKEKEPDLQPLRRLYSCMTVLAIILFSINVAQVLLIDKMHSKAWILGLPAPFLVLLMGLVVGPFWCPVLQPFWNKKSARARKIGTVLSIILPIFLCQFIYMPLRVLPAWHHTKWVVTVEDMPQIAYPALITSVPPNVNITSISCNASPYCDPGPIHNVTVSGDWNGSRYFILNTSDLANGVPQATVNNEPRSVGVFLRFEVNGTANNFSDINVLLGLFDPVIDFNYTYFRLGCSTPPYYDQYSVTLTNKGYKFINTIASKTHDELGLTNTGKYSTANGICSTALQPVKSYMYYDGDASYTRGEPIYNSSCDVGNTTTYQNGAYCQLKIGYTIKSHTVSTQTVCPGIEPLTIFLEEAGILGAALWFTWFFGIFDG